MDIFSDSGSEHGSSSSSGSSSAAHVDIIERGDASDGADAGFHINEEYAARFQHNKEREELQRLQEKHGKAGPAFNGDEDGSSSDDETEDEDGEQMTADVDAAILATLAKIRRKDESIYEAGKRVFDEERSSASQSKLLPRQLKRGDAVASTSGRNKKVTLGEYQRKRIQELLKTSDDPARALADATMIERRSDGAHFYDDEEAAMPVSHNKEQEQLRREVTSAFHDMAGVEGDDGDFFTAADKGRMAGNDDVDDDPESYRRYLVDVLGGKEDELRNILRSQTQDAAAEADNNGASSADNTVAKKEERRRNISMHTKDTEQDNEEFLTNYILNRGWMDNPHAAPTRRSVRDREVENDSDDDDAASNDSFASRAEAFENAYNFRFQEMEEGNVNPQIQSYARRIEGSARRQENKRKREREERAKRKDDERQQKRKELDRMRDLKRKSIVDRLKALREATGSTAITFDSLDLNADFDPAEHDRLMAQAFDDDYYGDDADTDMKKPTWDDDLDIDDIIREQDEKDALNAAPKTAAERKAEKKRKNKEKQAMKAEEDYKNEDDGLAESGKKLSKADKKKLKKREEAKARKAEENAVEEQVGVDEMDADNDTGTKDSHVDENIDGMSHHQRKRKMEEMMNEYYGLEYEDMIGDQPTRFKYTEVAKSDYGLTPEEILLADDQELNKIVGLKRLQPYRHRAGRRATDRGPADLKIRLKEFRRNFYKNDGSREQEDGKPQKKAGKRERERRKAAKAAAEAAEAATHEQDISASSAVANDGEAKKHKKRKDEGESTSGKTKKSKRESIVHA